MSARKNPFVIALALAASVLALALTACGGGGGGGNDITGPGVSVNMSVTKTDGRCGTADRHGVARSGDTLEFEVAATATGEFEGLVDGNFDGPGRLNPVLFSAGNSTKMIPYTLGGPGRMSKVFPRVDSLGYKGAEVPCWIDVQ